MATSTIAADKNPTFDAVKIKSTVDFPLDIVEVANEDYKGIRITINDVVRYKLTFATGHLYFQSFDADGKSIVSGQIK